MPGGATTGQLNHVSQALADHRLSMVGATGAKGLIKNARTFAIAVFASMGGLIYGYNQGMFGQILSMHSFSEASGVTGIQNPTLSGFLTAILELGAWVGVLMNGYVSDAIGRRKCVIFGVAWFILGVIIQACTRGGSYDYILAGRSITGVGIGSLSMIVPLYNAELAPPEIRGSLVALQQVSSQVETHTNSLTVALCPSSGSFLLSFFSFFLPIAFHLCRTLLTPTPSSRHRLPCRIVCSNLRSLLSSLVS